jgi:hypothetical protein
MSTNPFNKIERTENNRRGFIEENDPLTRLCPIDDRNAEIIRFITA